MHAGINRSDGRHWCAPDTAEDGETLVFCDCGKVWSYDAEERVWSELVEDEELPGFPDAGKAD